MLEFAQNRFAKSLRLRTIEQIFVERAIWADSRAKGNVNVNMSNWACGGSRARHAEAGRRRVACRAEKAAGSVATPVAEL